MIPTIETIVEDLVIGAVSKQQAIAWLYAHSEGAANDLRDHFAAQAISDFRSSTETTLQQDAEIAYKLADAMMAERVKARP